MIHEILLESLLFLDAYTLDALRLTSTALCELVTRSLSHIRRDIRHVVFDEDDETQVRIVPSGKVCILGNNGCMYTGARELLRFTGTSSSVKALTYFRPVGP